MNELDMIMQTRVSLGSYVTQKKESEKLYEIISKIIIAFLVSEDQGIYETLIEILKKRNDSFEFKINSELMRLNSIFSIVDIEKEMNCKPFYKNCKRPEDLLSKYREILFAIYRIEANVNRDYVEESIDCIIDSGISPLAAYIISRDVVSFKKPRTLSVLMKRYEETGDYENANICSVLLMNEG